jgi:hypothetical protein
MSFKLATTDLCLPWFESAIPEHLFNFFQALSRRLGIRYVRLYRSTEAQYTEYNKCFPGYIVECGWNEEAKSKLLSSTTGQVRIKKKALTLKSQLAIEAKAIPYARVSNDQTSAA